MKTALHSDISKQFSQAASAIEEVRAVAEYLAELMRGIHGGDWRIQIDHDIEFIFILPRPDQQSRGEQGGMIR